MSENKEIFEDGVKIVDVVTDETKVNDEAINELDNKKGEEE